MREYLRKRRIKYYHESRFRHLHIAGDIIFIFLILALAGTLFYLRHFQPFSGVEVEIKNPQEVVSGQEGTWQIVYHANKAITKNTLTVRWPDNFVITKVDFPGQYNSSTNTFYLDDLEKGGNGKISVSGIPFGALGARHLASATFNCVECGVGYLSSSEHEIKASALQADLLLPEEIYSGAEFATTLKLKNTGQKDLTKISFTLGDNWNIEDGDKTLEHLAPGEEKEILWRLSNSLKAGINPINLEIKSEDLTQVNLKKELDLKESSLKLALVPREKVASRQGTMQYVLSYDNLSQDNLNNLLIDISGATSIKASNLPSGWKLRGTSVYLEKLAAQESGQLVLDISYNAKRTGVNQILTLQAVASYDVPGGTLKLNFKAEPVKLKSDTVVKATAYYYSPQGDQLGVGPLPPEIGMATNYWIIVELENNGNKLNNFSLMADLPSQVFLTGNRSVLSGEFYYAPVSDSIVWKLASLEANQSKYKLGVEISLAPEEADLGKVLILASNWHYKATDEFTGQEISGTLGDLDTNLKRDPLAAGRGTVVAGE